MDVKFDMVRIGCKRSNVFTEQVIQNNTILLKSKIRDLLVNETCTHKENIEYITMIIPAKGNTPKIRIQDIKDKCIRRLVKNNLPDFIYKGRLDDILDNIDNRIFR